MNIGYIGLGALGNALARRFIAGHSLVVWDLSASARQAFEGTGARVADSPADLARRSDVVITCLPRSSDVSRLIFGDDGLAQGLTAGQLLIDQTSGVPSETADIAVRLADLGVSMIDAAVSASPQFVPAGIATIMMSGPAEALGRAVPLLHAISTNILPCGDRVGDAQAMKMVNNAINASIRLGTLELTALGRKAGICLRTLSEHFTAGAARNLTTDRMLPALLRGETSTDFALSLMLKDLNQAVEFGMAKGVSMPIASATRVLLQMGLNLRGTGARLEDMVGVIAQLADTSIADGPEASSTPPAELLPQIDGAIASLCRAATRECVAAGFAHGLRVADMRQVLSQTSGWSTAGRQWLAAIEDDMTEAASIAPVAPTALSLQASLLQANRLGVPLLLPAMVHALSEPPMA